MDNLRPPDVLDMIASEGVCRQTANGWLYYCDEHDTHGNADSQEEADVMAEAHVAFHSPDGEDPCDVLVWQRTQHERT